MRELDVGLFLGVDDIEIGQYHILSAFKVCRDGYFSKRIYPSLAKLIELKHVLEAVINGEVYLREKFPRKIIEFDVENAKVIYGPLPSASKRVQVTIELIEWALPQIQRLIEEGIAIFDFVERNVEISSVGIRPLYKDEGYFFVGDNMTETLKLHRYECGLFTSGKEKYRALKTNFLKEVPLTTIHASLVELKLELIATYPELPNPSTFVSQTQLEFPFSETVLPVAKRKLMSAVVA